MTTPRFAGLIGALIAGLFLISPLEAAQGIVSADSFVNPSAVGLNFGWLPSLEVGNGSMAFIQLDLTTLPPGTLPGSVGKATLTFYINRMTNPGGLSVSQAIGGWTESGLVPENAPVPGQPFATLQVTSAGQYISVDITAQVQGWLSNPGSNNGIAIGSTGAVGRPDSKEN